MPSTSRCRLAAPSTSTPSQPRSVPAGSCNFDQRHGRFLFAFVSLCVAWLPLGAFPAAHPLTVNFSSVLSFACLGRTFEKGHDLVDANPGHFRHCRTNLAACWKLPTDAHSHLQRICTSTMPFGRLSTYGGTYSTVYPRYALCTDSHASG